MDDLPARLDRSIGPAPDGDDGLTTLLDRGHRAVARRRLAAAGASAAAVLLVAGGAALAAGGGPDRATPSVAGEPSSSPESTPESSLEPTATPTSAEVQPTRSVEPTATPTSAGVEPTPPDPTRTVLWDGQLAAFDPGTGALVVADGATVTERIENPFDVPAPEQSLGLAVEKDGTTYWYALYRAVGGGGTSSSRQAGSGTLADWLPRQADIVTANDPPYATPHPRKGSGPR
jgi:hypothetical protein